MSYSRYVEPFIFEPTFFIHYRDDFKCGISLTYAGDTLNLLIFFLFPFQLKILIVIRNHYPLMIQTLDATRLFTKKVNIIFQIKNKEVFHDETVLD